MGQLWMLLFSSVLITSSGADRIVLTESGPVRGVTVASGKVEAFLGIPFAEPPVGQLRFAKPLPKKPWTEVYDATELPPTCIQMDTGVSFMSPDLKRMSEDCLHLNVWVPETSKGGGAKAVMLFIHGGGFYLGSSNTRTYDGARLAERGDVVVVTINYRVGALGFFAGNTEGTEGNQGLHDQILALKWVRENARHFGGDPHRVTIFGQSAGAFSVSLLQLSPSSRDLFRRAILQSGSAINPMYTVGNAEAAKINALFSQLQGCGPASDEAVLKCMRALPAEAFAKADMVAFQKGVLLLLPHFGEELFPGGAISLFEEGRFKDSEVLMGVTRDEGSFGVWFIHSILTGGGDGEFDFNRTTAYNAIRENSLTRMLLAMTTQERAEAIVQGYLDDAERDSSDDYSYVRAVGDALGDAMITCSLVFQAELQSARGDAVHFYMFDHRTANSPFPEWTGVPHFEEVPYVFGNPLVGTFTEEEEELSRDLMDMWSAFAKTGDPNIPGSLQWPKFTSKDPRYLRIAGKDRVETRPDNHRCERWRNIFFGANR